MDPFESGDAHAELKVFHSLIQENAFVRDISALFGFGGRECTGVYGRPIAVAFVLLDVILTFAGCLNSSRELQLVAIVESRWSREIVFAEERKVNINIVRQILILLNFSNRGFLMIIRSVYLMVA